MSNYSLISIELVDGKTKNIFKLEVNGVCEFDQFCDMLKKNGKAKAIGNIFATINSLEYGTKLPPKKIETLTRDKGDSIKDYRIRFGDYRIYYFRNSSGNIIVFGAHKKTQKKDIKRLRQIKRKYIKDTHT